MAPSRLYMLMDKVFLYGIPGAQMAFSAYLLSKAWSLTSNTKKKLKKREKSMYSLPMLNSLVHRLCGGAFLAHSIYNAVAVLRGESMSESEALFVFSICGLSTITIFPLLSDLPYSNTRIHRLFAISQYSSIAVLFTALSEATYIYHGNAFTKWQYLLTTSELVSTASISVLSVLDFIDSSSILVSKNKNNTVLKKRESRSYRQPHLRQSSALHYNAVNRVMLRSYKKIFQKTLRNDSEEYNTSVKQHTAAVLAALLTGFVPTCLAVGRIIGKIYQHEKYVNNFDDFGRITRIALPLFAFNIVAPFTWTLYARGSITHSAAKSLILSAFGLLLSWPMYPMLVNRIDNKGQFKDWQYFSPKTLLTLCMK
mmetsp:Transcript_26843/g.42509  ORF Transcript_26843/g.42509 Transcript_26843/m.42509 type:complete len:368 (+) Transcript_26843:126-1229(+)